MNAGYLTAGRTGLIMYDNELANVNCSISCVGVQPSYAANFSTSKAVTGTIVSDDLIIGRTDQLVQRGVEEKVHCLTFPSVIAQGGNVNLSVSIPYVLQPGQQLVVYEVEFPTGGSGTGVEGLVFRVDAYFGIVFNNTGLMNFRQVIATNTTSSQTTGTFSTYLHNLPSAGLGNFTIAPGNIVKFKYKIVEYSIDAY